MAPRKKRKTEALTPSSIEDPSKAAPDRILDANNATQKPKVKRKSAPKETSTTSRRHTRGMTTDAARKAVFNTSELLESILVCLPPKTLFGVQRVSKQFQAIIATSIPIQEKMFLRIRNKPKVGWYVQGPDFVESSELNSGEYTAADLNPFLEPDSYVRTAKHTPSPDTYEEPKLVLGNPLTLASLDGKGPSIWDTYISDPPFDDLEITFFYQLPEYSIKVYRYMVGEARGNGTLRDLICQAMVDDGTAYVGSKRHKTITQTRGYDGITEIRRVIENYENISESMAGFNPGISEINFRLFYWYLPTEAQRAEAEARGAGA